MAYYRTFAYYRVSIVTLTQESMTKNSPKFIEFLKVYSLYLFKKHEEVDVKKQSLSLGGGSPLR